jgi:hypothetical protein
MCNFFLKNKEKKKNKMLCRLPDLHEPIQLPATMQTWKEMGVCERKRKGDLTPLFLNRYSFQCAISYSAIWRMIDAM